MENSQISFYDENEDIRIVTNGYGEYIGEYKQSEKEKHTKNQINGWLIHQKKEAAKHAVTSPLGSYFHYIYVKLPGDLDKKFKVYMLKMCTSLNYNDNYIYSGNKNNPNRFIISKDKDMMEFLGIKDKKTYANIRNTLKENDILFKDDKGYYINPKAAIKGDIKFTGGGYTRVFIKGFNELYANEKDKSAIGYLTELIPHLNIEYNIICHNPEETELEKVNPMTLVEIAEVLGVDQKNSVRLKNSLLRLTINNDNAFGIFIKGTTSIFLVNPNIYYSGGSAGISYLEKIFKIGM